MARRKPTESDTDALVALTSRQAAAADLVAVGRSDQDVADAVGCSRQTVNVWRNHHPAFAVAVEDRRREVWSACRDGVLSLLPRAVDAVSDGLDGPAGWRVGLALLKLAGVAEGDYGLRPNGPRDVGSYIDGKARKLKIAALCGSEPEIYRKAAQLSCVLHLEGTTANGNKVPTPSTHEESDVLP